MTPPHAIDVSGLPPYAFDTRAPVWWGNTLLILIETTTFAILVVGYFYVTQNFQDWPPVRVMRDPPLKDPVPDLGPGTGNVVLLLAGCLPMFWADRSARRNRRPDVLAGLGLCVAVGLGGLALRFLEFPAVKFSWSDSAYGSFVWAILVMHLVHIVVATAEVLILLVWLARYGMDERHAADVTLTAVYWYWMAGMWLLLYAVVYWAPRLL